MLIKLENKTKEVSFGHSYLITSEGQGELVFGWARAQPAGLNIRGNSTRGLRP